jgi:hypothetical protein
LPQTLPDAAGRATWAATRTPDRISRIAFVCTASDCSGNYEKIFRRVSHAKNFIIATLAFVLGGGAVFFYLNHSAKSNSYATMHAMHHGTVWRGLLKL